MSREQTTHVLHAFMIIVAWPSGQSITFPNLCVLEDAHIDIFSSSIMSLELLLLVNI